MPDDSLDFDMDGPPEETPPPPPEATPTPAPRRVMRMPPVEPKRAGKWERREKDVTPRYQHETSAAPGRVPPHSVEAEEMLLSAGLLDGADVVARCLDAKVAPASFYVPANRVIYEKMLVIHADKRPIDLALLAEELKGTRQLDEIGGYAYLTRISGRIPTTANASYFIAKVKELELLRSIVTEATRAVEAVYGYSGDLDEIKLALDRATYRLDEAQQPVGGLIQSFDDFDYPVDDPDCLIGVKGRYLGRGGSLLIPAPSGIGKSSSSYQMAACWGTGREFIGMIPARPLRVLIVQMEDDRGDVGEVRESVYQGLGFNERDRAMIRRNMFVIRDRVHIGDDFHDALRRYVRHTKPDIVIINPLMRYCPGLSKEEIAGPFLSRLDALADEFGFCIVAFHHTPKPPTKDDAKSAGKPAKKEAIDRQYTAFGSSALTNWPRAIINIAGVRGTDGKVFVFQFDKRGRRAGVVVEKEQGMGTYKETVTELVVKHSSRTITVGGRSFPMVLWERHENQNLLKEMEDAEQEERRPKREPRPEQRPAPGRKWDESEVLGMFPFGERAALPIQQIKKRAESVLLMPPNVFAEFRHNLLFAGKIFKRQDDCYYKQ